MSFTKYYNSGTGKWEMADSPQASTISILDVGNNFKDKNVESALREISSKSNSNAATVKGVESSILDLSNNFQFHIQNHPGGSGGGGTGSGSGCTITSTFEGGVIDNDTDLYIPLFFTPSIGAVSGTAYVMINNIEIGSQMVERGNSRVHIGILPSIKNSISIYVRDSRGAMSEMLSWEVIKGGIDFSLQFDYNSDYSIDDVIRCPYTITSAIESPLILEITIDNIKTELPVTTQGYNEYVFAKLNVGIHKVKMIVTSGIYRSKEYNFNLIVVSSYNLYVSSTFENREFESGTPIIYDYRISKISSEMFDVKLLLDNVVQKTLSAPTGAYTWTIPSLPIGEHILTVEVRNGSEEFASVTNTVTIYAGEYTPLQEVTGGLLASFSSRSMTNEDIKKEVWTDLSGNNVVANLHNFNFKTNGWIETNVGSNCKERVLRCDNEAYVEIDMKPYESNVKLGSTIDILYKSKNIGFEDARIIDYTDTETPYKGFYADVNKTVLRSATNTGTVNLDEDSEIRLTYVIDRINKFGLIYVNGVINRAFYLSDTGSGVNAFYEDFSHSSKIYLNSEKGIKNFGAVDIKRLRVYGRALSGDEILQNHIADIEDITVQRERYKFNFDNKTTPVIKLFCDKKNFDNMSDTTSIPCRVKYESPNEDFYGQSFDLPYCDVNWQGTSSLQYVLKNYTIRLKDENLEEYLYTPYKNGIKESVFCLKVDYMESSHSHNVGMAKFINSSVYDTKTPAQMIDPNYRTTIDGFPILVYINYNDGNGDTLMGAYNFNLDRYSTESFGFKKFPKLLAYEVSANSDTTAGAFFKWTSGSGKTEIDYYKSDFEMIYPYSRVGNDNYAELIRLVNWVDSASDEMFKEQVNEYFNLEYLLRYYLVVMVIGAVDSLGKNMKLITYDGLIWYPQFYDLDTILGLDNTGFLKFGTDIEVVEGVFNTSASKLWEKVARLFAVELQREYALMRLDRFTVDNMMKYVYKEQVQAIPERVYNLDMKIKYLNFGSSYLYACHGNRAQQIKKWLRERLVYTDTLMKYTNSTSDFITLRSSKLGLVYLDIQTYLPMYLTVKWRDEPDIIINGEVTNAGKQTKRVGANETVRFEFTMPTATDQEIVIYAGRYLKSLGDVSNLKPTSMLLGNANKLTSIECHSPNLINVDLAQLLNVQHVDLSDCTALGTGIGAMPTVDLAKCSYLKTLNFYNTKLTAIYTNLNGGSIEKIIYPKSIQAINVRNQERLKVLGVPYNELDGTESINLANVDVHNCPNLERFSIDESSEEVFKPLKYVQNLTLMNSLILPSIKFDSFKRLKNISLTNMYQLYNCEFNDLNNVGDVATLQNIIIQNCPLIENLTFNVSSNEKSIIFLRNAILDLSQAYSLKSIKSNTIIKGLETIILPEGIRDLIFTREYGSTTGDIKNLWSYSTAKPNSDVNYQGIDFKDLNIRDIDLSSTLLIPNTKNLNVAPVSVINLQGSRDNITYPLLPINGVIDLTNYTGSCIGLFKGMDLSNVTIIKENDFIQTDFTSMFENTIIGINTDISAIMSKIKTVTNSNRMFANSSISTPHMFAKVNDGADLSEMYAGSLITSDVNIPLNVGNITNLFKNCMSLTHIHSNWNREYSLEIITTSCYSGCTSITHMDEEDLYVNEFVSGLDPVPINWGGYGFEKDVTGVYEFLVPSDNYTITLGNLVGDEIVNWGDNVTTNNINSHLYKTAGRYIIKGHIFINKNVVAEEIDYTVKESLINVYQIPNINSFGRILFKGCTNLQSVDIRNSDTINLINITNMFTDCNSISRIIFPSGKIKVSSDSTITNLFKNCSLISSLDMNSFDFSNVTFTNMSGVFDGCVNLTTLDVNNLNTVTVTNMAYMFNGCNLLTKLDLINFNVGLVTDMSAMFQNCSSLVSLNLNNFTTPLLINTNCMFNGCSSLISLELMNFSLSSSANIDQMLLQVPSNSVITIKSDIFRRTEIQCSFTGTFNLIIVGEFARYTFDNNLGDCLPYSCTVAGGYSYRDIKIVGNVKTRVLYPTDGVSKPTILSFRDRTSLVSVISIDTSNLTSMGSMFYGCTALTSLDLTSFNTINVTDMTAMFYGCTGLIRLGLSSFDTSKVTVMNSMFNGCPVLTTLDLSSFDTSNVTTMNYMFSGCTGLTTLDLSSFDTSKVTIMRFMFNSCTSLTSLDLTSFNTINVTDMTAMFNNCTGLISLDLSSLNVKSTTTVTPMFTSVPSTTEITVKSTIFTKTETECSFTGIFNWIFAGEFARYTFDNSLGDCLPYACTVAGGYSYKDVKIVGNIKTRVLYPNDGVSKPTILSFRDKTSLTSVISMDTSSITSMTYMFKDCSGLTSLDLSSFDTSNVTDMNFMFTNCPALTSINLSNFNTSSLIDMSYMFYGCSKLTSLDLSSFNTESVKNMGYVFYRCNKLTSLDLSNFNTENVTTMKYMFFDCAGLTLLELTNFNTSNVTAMDSMFVSCTALTTLDLSSFDVKTTTTVTSMFSSVPSTAVVTVTSGLFTKSESQCGFTGTFNRLFYNGEIIGEFARYTFNVKTADCLPYACTITGGYSYKDVSGEETIITRVLYSNDGISKPTVLSFRDKTSLTSVISMDTSSITSMTYMFKDCSGLTSLDLSSFDTSNVTDMSYIFHSCTALTTLDLTSFNTANVTNMSYMFRYCSKLTSINLSSFDTSNVTTMTCMFYACSGFTTLDLSNFNVKSTVAVLSTFQLIPSTVVITITSELFTKTETECSFTGIFNRLFYTGEIVGEFARYTFNVGIADCLPATCTITGGYSYKDVAGEGAVITRVLYPTDGISKPIVLSFKSKVSLTSIIITDTLDITSMAYMFYNCANLISADLRNLNTSKVTDMNRMFLGCNSLTTLDLTKFDTSKITNFVYAFQLCASLTSLDLSNFDTSSSTAMDCMFNGCTGLISLDLSSFNTANVTTMAYMFSDCTTLISLELSNFDTSKVIDMNCMFRNCINLTSLNLSNFNTLSVINMNYMFNNCPKLTTLYLSNFNTSNVTTMAYMFNGCVTLTSLDLSNFNVKSTTTATSMFLSVPSSSSITVMSGLFTKTETECGFTGTFNWIFPGEFARYTFDNSLGDCFPYDCTVTGGYSYKNVKINGNVRTRILYATDGISKPTSLSFRDRASLLSVINFDTSNVINMNYMFSNCTALTSLDLSSFDTSKVTNFSYMFYSCTALATVDLSNFNTTNVTNMYYMFYGCSNLTSLNLSSFDTSKVTIMSSMFNGCIKLSTINLSSFDLKSVTDVSNMFLSVKSTSVITVTSELFNKTEAQCNFTGTFNRLFYNGEIIGEFARYTFNAKPADCIPYACTIEGGYSIRDIAGEGAVITRVLYANDGISKPTVLSFLLRTSLVSVISIDTSNVTDMSSMFNSCTSLTSLNLSSFDTSKVTSMYCMFYNCITLAILDLSSFNTVNVIDMNSMFNNCTNLTSLNLSSFDTSKATAMSSMFYNCTTLEILDLSSFNTVNVTTMAYMLYSCTNLTSLNLSSFDTSKATDIRYIFYRIPSTSAITVTSGLFTKTETECAFAGTFVKIVPQSYIDELPYTNEPQILSLNNSNLTDEQIVEITEKGYTIV